MIKPGEDLLREALTEAVAQLTGSRNLTVVEVAADGITTFDLHRDDVGTPRGRYGPVMPWTDLASERGWERPHAESAEQAVVRAAGVLSDAAVILVCSSDNPLTDQVMKWLRAARPESLAFTQADVRVETLLREVITNEPLCRSYDLVVLKRHPMTRRLEFAGNPLFTIGARRGDVVEVAVRCEPSDDRGTVFAVVAWQDRLPQLLSVHTAKLSPGHYEFTAELERPSRVRFAGLPGLVRDDRGWAELVTSVPLRLDSHAGPAHLICAVEVSGAPEQVRERLSRIRQMLTAMSGGLPGRLQVSLVAYGAHSYDRRIPEKPIEVIDWLVSPERSLVSLTRLEQRGAVAQGYVYAAQLEDMLAEIARRLSHGGLVRTVLLTVGDRPPHPPRVHQSGVLPCPYRHDWDLLLRRIEQHPGMAFGAICDQPAERADSIWFRLGGGAPAYLKAVDIRRLSANLGLAVPQIPFPLIEVP